MTESTAISLSVLLISFVLTAVLEKILIPVLSKCAKQPIYEDGPSWHLSKSGTPTMGGLAFIAVAVPILCTLSFYLISVKKSESALTLIFALAFALLNSAVGVIDDLTKLRNKQNAGLTPKQKLILQFLIAVLYLILLIKVLHIPTSVSFPFGNIDLGFLYLPVMAVMLVGIVNCANLTDGIDGLASSVALTAAISLIAITHNEIPEVSYTCFSIIGISAGFLIFNFHPAKIFMGDTGSLFLGALIAAQAMSLKNPFAIIALCSVYVIEGVSVILQVFFYKATEKRLFKMAPLHHHFEKSGFTEVGICALAVTVTIVFSCLAYLLN